MINTLISLAIKASKSYGLSNFDIQNANEFLLNNEMKLAIDTLITQLYEYNIKIDLEFYELIQTVANLLEISRNEYSYLKELISLNTISEDIKNEIIAVINRFKY